MISALTGELRRVDDDRVHLQAGPILYELLVPAADLTELQASLGETLTFHTIFYLGGDPSRGGLEPTLIGFLRAADRQFFNIFTTVKGVGPKTALKALTVPVGQIANANADVVSIHVILSDRSRGLVGAKDLNHMKKTAYLINTARGPIVDEKALVAALQGKQIAGAGLDVFDVEPLPLDHPYRKMDNVVITPHLGYVSTQNYARYFPDIVADIRGWLDGKPVRVIS